MEHIEIKNYNNDGDEQTDKLRAIPQLKDKIFKLELVDFFKINYNFY